MPNFLSRFLYICSIVSTGLLVLVFIFSYQQAQAENILTAGLFGADKFAAPALSIEAVHPTDEKNLAMATVKPAKVANSLKVDAMTVNSEIFEGQSSKTLNKGLWHIPGTSTPDKGGNMVIAAHRWYLLPQSGKSFFNIEKVGVGDSISLQWQGKTYNYKVNKTKYVKPTEVSILANTPKPQLTLFSCAPLFSSKYRFVVQADLINIT